MVVNLLLSLVELLVGVGVMDGLFLNLIGEGVGEIVLWCGLIMMRFSFWFFL